jgi:phosphoglycerate dehydrogenase-like enzyme
MIAALPDGAVFVNVGRGDLVSSGTSSSSWEKTKRLTSDLLLEALDAEGGLDSIALDVTDPEPLPDNHPFFTHPRVIITPHTSGGVEGYLDKAADLLIANVEQIRNGGGPINKVDWKKGY